MIILSNGEILKGRYCVLEQIGQGGEGQLYLARDMELGIHRAVKELPICDRKEAKLLLMLDHPALPQMVDYEEMGEFCYIIMEYIKGRTLRELWQKKESLPVKEVLRFGISACQVLGYLHSRSPSVCYGDVKPDNFMVSEGRLRLVDLGSARIDYGVVSNGVCKGTKGYAAPEQYEGKVVKESDIYALGKTMWVLLGRNRRWLLFVCPQLLMILRKCCRKNIRQRYHDIGILEKKLEKLLKQYRESRIKNMLAVSAYAFLFFLAVLGLVGYQKKIPDFYACLSDVTGLYYKEDFLTKDKTEQIEICKKVEKKLQEMLKQYKDKNQQSQLLGLLAANSEVCGEYEHSALYYEQLLMYEPEYPDGYGEYGMFLLRIGQKEKSRELWKRYQRICKYLSDETLDENANKTERREADTEDVKEKDVRDKKTDEEYMRAESMNKKRSDTGNEDDNETKKVNETNEDIENNKENAGKSLNLRMWEEYMSNE